MPNWFVRKTAKEDAVDWILKHKKIFDQPEIKGVIEKTNFIYNDIVEKKGFIAGIQMNICMCGREHDEFVVMKEEILAKEEWKDKERLTVICKECQEVFLLISDLYSIEKAKKVLKVLWDGKAGWVAIKTKEQDELENISGC